MVRRTGTSIRSMRAGLSAFLVKYDTSLGVGFLVGLCGLWFVFATQQEAAYPKLHAVGIRDWAVACEGGGRTYRLESGNVSGYRSGASVIQRSLSLFDGAGEELYYTQRFDPDAYERDGVWSFTTGRDSRLVAPRKRAREVLYGDEARFEIGSAFDVLTVVTEEGGRLTLACR